MLGASVALGDDLVSHPDLLHVVADTSPGTGVDAVAVRAELLRAVAADPEEHQPVAGSPSSPRPTPCAARTDHASCGSPRPTSPHPNPGRHAAVAAALADLAAAALEASLAIARSELDDHGAGSGSP
ncbi:hypothetical protein NKG05_25715 [Oerskovia sp. M15]